MKRYTDVPMKNEVKENIILKLTFEFSILIIEFAEILESNRRFVIANQILKSGTSIGANVREAQNAESKADFIHKLSIAQKECNETIYWLELMNATGYLNSVEFESLNNDAIELIKIITTIIKNTKQNLTPNP